MAARHGPKVTHARSGGGIRAQLVGADIRGAQRAGIFSVATSSTGVTAAVHADSSDDHAGPIDVAIATGFTSHSYFAQSYRLQFGRPPSEERRMTAEPSPARS